MSNLEQIRDVAQDIAEAISAVIQMEVTIVSEDFTRLGGSGDYKTRVNQSFPHNSMFAKVLETGRPEFLPDSKASPECQTCLGRHECRELATVGHPIIGGTKTIGVIGITAFNEDQRLRLTENIDSIMVFLGRMSSLLVDKVDLLQALDETRFQSGQISQIIDTIESGLISLNDKGVVLHFNRSAERILGLAQDDVTGGPIGRFITNFSLNLGHEPVMVDWNVAGRKVRVMAKTRQVPAQPTARRQGFGTIVTFDRMEEVVDLTYSIWGSGDRALGFESLIGNSPILRQVVELAQRVARSSSTVLILGESGTGKELLARAIHQASDRRHHPLITINCSAIPDNLLESELFGYEDGAFTGARRGGKLGKFELAHKGTIFLDEIADLPLSLQPKLLRVLQERQVERVGGTRPINVDVRVISATHDDLERRVEEGRFRADLYYRLNVIPLTLPPLRFRGDDVIALAEHLVDKYRQLLHSPVIAISDAVRQILGAYPWPGNVRELENAIEYSLNVARGAELTVDDLPPNLRRYGSVKPGSLDLQAGASLEDIMAEHERDILRRALEKHGNTVEAKGKIADALSISVATLYRKLAKHGLGAETA